MPTYFDDSLIFKGEYDQSLEYNKNDIAIIDGNAFVYMGDDAWDGISLSSITYDPKDSVYYTTTAIDTCIYNNYHEPKHFNCKCCGAPNQVDVCEYCGSAYEE